MGEEKRKRKERKKKNTSGGGGGGMVVPKTSPKSGIPCYKVRKIVRELAGCRELAKQTSSTGGFPHPPGWYPHWALDERMGRNFRQLVHPQNIELGDTDISGIGQLSPGIFMLG